MTVTAIAGPWLRLETVHQIKANKRVLVVMKIDNAVAKPEENGFESQVVEDIGEIKNIEQKKDIFIVSVELMGLSDSDIDHLVSVARRVAVAQSVAEEKKTENPELAAAGTGR
jgi:hypothetical protein